MSFPDIDILRTDEGFILNNDSDSHQDISPLINIQKFGAMSNVPLDYMHIVCLGVIQN